MRRLRQGAVISALALMGCAHPGQPTAPPTAVTTTEHRSAVRDPVLSLLDYAHHLSAISPDAREDVVKTTRDHVRKTPNATDYARLAIALGTPGQRLYTPDEAARYAQLSLKTRPSPWSPAARQYLSDYARLYTQLTKDQSAESDDSDSDEQARENRRIEHLRSELEEAHRKLRELAHIEERLDSADSGS